MAFSAIEWIVLIFAIAGLIKVLVFLFNKSKWMPVVDFFYGKPTMTGLVMAVLAAVILYFLLAELTIVQILASGAFMASLMYIGFLSYSSEMRAFARKALSGRTTGLMWLYVIVWVALLVWALWTIFQ